MKVAQIQMNSRDDKAENLRSAETLINRAVEVEKPDLIVLPEYFSCLTEIPEQLRASSEQFPDGQAFKAMSALAARHRVIIHAGSMVERNNERFYNTSVVFGPDGREMARYRKIHLFDVVVPGGLHYEESETFGHGSEIVTYRAGDFTVGCSICYDLRFPELFRKLRDAGAEVIVLPAAFTLQTGKDHWEVLNRARAIETQTFVLATAQVFSHADGKKSCWGHTMAIDPWGHIIAQASDRVGYITARLDKAHMAEIRQNLPVANHHVLC